MELKKSEKADLENKKGIFFQIGLIFAMTVMLLAFEYKNYDTPDLSTYSGPRATNEVEELVTITQQNTQPPPPPPPTPSLVLNIVENTVVVNNDIAINAEADENTQVDEIKPGVVVKQDEEAEVEERQIFMVVENVPAFPGGDIARQKFLKDNIQYPQMARESGIQGTVYVGFVIERDGSVTNVKILRGIGGGCDQEALRVIMNMPRWEPGKQRGKPVRVQLNMPIIFALAG